MRDAVGDGGVNLPHNLDSGRLLDARQVRPGERPEAIQQLVISRAISGLRIESAPADVSPRQA